MISVQRLRGRSRASAASHTLSAGPYRTPHRVLVQEHQQLSGLRPVAAERQDSQPLPRHACWR
jgi:hypothetical protein